MIIGFLLIVSHVVFFMCGVKYAVGQINLEENE
jgi:hypothetical protein